MTRTVKHMVMTRCPRENIWPLYVAWHSDPANYRPIFHELRWSEGEPWKQGSRLQVEMKFPYPFRVNQVITFCVPGEKVSWINHSMGITTQQEITFRSKLSGETEIASVVDIVGHGNPLAWPAEKVIGQVVQQALDSIRNFCDRACPPKSHSQTP